MLSPKTFLGLWTMTGGLFWTLAPHSVHVAASPNLAMFQSIPHSAHVAYGVFLLMFSYMIFFM